MSRHRSVARWAGAPLATAALVGLLVGCQDDAGPSADLGAPTRDLELAVSDTVTAVVATHCGYEWLEVVVNDQLWRTAELGADEGDATTEPEWPEGEAAAQLELHLVDADTLEVTAVGSDVTRVYEPTTEPSGCE